MRGKIFLTLALFLLFASAGFSDLIHLKSGKMIEGEVISETEEKVSVRLPMGKSGDIIYSVKKDNIKEIEKAPVSYDFITEEDVEEESIPSTDNGFSFKSIIKYGVSMFDRDGKGKGISYDGLFEKSRNYIMSSEWIGFMVDFLLFILAALVFNSFRKDSNEIASKMKKMKIGGILGRWIFFMLAIMVIQLKKFGSFNFFVSGPVSILLFAVMFYETLGLFIMIFFRKQYEKFISGGNFFNVMVFKIPMACEFSLFAYLFIMDMFVLFI